MTNFVNMLHYKCNQNGGNMNYKKIIKELYDYGHITINEKNKMLEMTDTQLESEFPKWFEKPIPIHKQIDNIIESIVQIDDKMLQVIAFSEVITTKNIPLIEKLHKKVGKDVVEWLQTNGEKSDLYRQWSEFVDKLHKLNKKPTDQLEHLRTFGTL